jgi:adenylate cyclase
MKKIFPLLFIFHFLFFIHCFSQRHGQAKIDSLEGRLPLMKEDTNKVDIYNMVSKIYCNIHPDSGIKYGTKALNLASKLGDSLKIFASCNNIGNCYRAKSEYSKALNYFFRGLRIVRQKGYKKGEAALLNNIGNIYSSENNYPRALDYYQSALKINEERKDKNFQARNLSNIANIYVCLYDTDNALKNYEQAMEIDEEIGDKENQTIILTASAGLYNGKGNHSKALQACFKSLKIEEELGSVRIEIHTYAALGAICDAMNNYEKSFEYYNKSLVMNRKLNDQIQQALNFYGLAEIFFDLTNDKDKALLDSLFAGNKNLALEKAICYADSSILLCNLTNNIDASRVTYLLLSKIEKKRGNISDALDYYEKYDAAKDSVFNTEKGKKITQLAMQYQFDKIQDSTRAEQASVNTINEKDKQRLRVIRNSFIGGFSIMFLASGMFFMQRRRIAKEKQEVEKQKKRSDELLLNILPSEVAEELKAKGSADAKAFDDVTVMFTDFKGFTAIAEELSAKELVAEIDYCFKGFDNIIHNHNIEKIKTIGDSYMCVGGLPVANKTHAKDVVSAALEIVKFMENHKQQRVKEGKPVFEIRIGINSGHVVAGIVGVKKFAYDIWGDTVNLASRMESSGEPGKVNISGSTYELVKNDFTCTHRGKIQAKNKGEVDMYFVNELNA